MAAHILGRVEEDQQTVTLDLGDNPVVAVDDASHHGEVPRQNPMQDLLRKRLRERGGVAQIREHDCDHPRLHIDARAEAATAHGAPHHLVGHELREGLDARGDPAEGFLQLPHLVDPRAPARPELLEGWILVGKVQVREPAHQPAQGAQRPDNEVADEEAHSKRDDSHAHGNSGATPDPITPILSLLIAVVGHPLVCAVVHGLGLLRECTVGHDRDNQPCRVVVQLDRERPYVPAFSIRRAAQGKGRILAFLHDCPIRFLEHARVKREELRVAVLLVGEEQALVVPSEILGQHCACGHADDALIRIRDVDELHVQIRRVPVRSADQHSQLFLKWRAGVHHEDCRVIRFNDGVIELVTCQEPLQFRPLLVEVCADVAQCDIRSNHAFEARVVAAICNRSCPSQPRDAALQETIQTREGATGRCPRGAGGRRGRVVVEFRLHRVEGPCRGPILDRLLCRIIRRVAEAFFRQIPAGEVPWDSCHVAR
mmetsp:Transcript_179732/g.570024  ORF Transcript_179732/g.570024 Transcript_179732/m.570024 type:complete len:484 (+) Transcript_179732:1333-2784(+)